jgi:N-acetylmuramic acid 6-phosphate etherase
VKRKNRVQGKTFLGIDGGGTRCVALLVDDRGREIKRVEAGQANVTLISDKELTDLLRYFARALPKPTAIGIGLAGAWATADTRRIDRAVRKVWPGVLWKATTDLDVALMAATNGAPLNSRSTARVLVVSGTGSCAFGINAHGDRLKIGGWGHVLGDKGSAYQIGMRALRGVVDRYDNDGHWPKLGERVLRTLVLNEPAELIHWAASASKTDIASLAVEVFAAAEQGDTLAKCILDRTLSALTQKALLCADRIAGRRQRVEFFLAGGVLLKQARFARQLAARIRRSRPGSRVTPLTRESVWGAVDMARQLVNADLASTAPVSVPPPPSLVRSTKMSPTERRNARSMELDKLRVEDAVNLMLSEEGQVARKLLKHQKVLERTVKVVSRAFQQGGRLFYVGAGTSGRLGVLDASECPVTFRSSPEIVQGIIAGGQPALFRAIEGAEDNIEAGREAIGSRGVGGRDVVLGIAASGTTPFVWGALGEARRRGATTVLLCFNPYLKISRALRPDIIIAADLGPEVLTGSTRLKAGTATKVVLNLITTLAMVQIGKVMSNLMVDVVPGNAKLRDRATRIVMALSNADRSAAESALRQTSWVIKQAVNRLAAKRSARAI